MSQEFLPLGTVVLLKGGDQKLLIYGKMQKDVDSPQCFDFVSVPFPQGFMSMEHIYLFNRDQIAKIVYMGHEDKDERDFGKLDVAI